MTGDKLATGSLANPTRSIIGMGLTFFCLFRASIELLLSLVKVTAIPLTFVRKPSAQNLT